MGIFNEIPLDLTLYYLYINLEQGAINNFCDIPPKKKSFSLTCVFAFPAILTDYPPMRALLA
jgi:hypothetical protein